MAEKKEVSHEENVITPEEFKELEKKEKRIRLKAPKKEEAPAAPRPARHEKATDMDMLVLKTEKIEGKLEAIEEFRAAMDERLSGMNQEIGELRSAIMEKDKAINQIQGGFAKIREIAEGMEPEKIAGQLARKEEEIEKNQAAIERLVLQTKELRKEIKANSDILEGIRDIKNVSSIIQTLRQKMGKIEEDRKFTSRTAGKIETMFSDLSENLGEFQSYKEKIGFNEETMHELMKTVDMLETRLDETARKDDLKKLEGAFEEGLERARTEMDDRLYDIRNLIDDLLTALKEGGIKGVLEKVGRTNLERTFATKSDVEEIRAKLDRLREAATQAVREKQREFARERPVPERKPPKAPPREAPARAAPRGVPERAARPVAEPSPVLAIQDRLDSLTEQAEEAIKLGNLEVAKNLYREALSLYNQLNDAESYQEAAALYERIRRLYSRLRIYS